MEARASQEAREQIFGGRKEYLCAGWISCRRDLPADSASVLRTRRSGRSSIVSEPSSILHILPKQTSGSVASRNQVVWERLASLARCSSFRGFLFPGAVEDF